MKEPEYKKLRKSIEKYGFRFPVFVWNNCILDGHQRVFTINRMITEGWSIVKIPVVDIEADNEKEAKKLLLLVSSRYGHVTEEGFYEFLSLSDLDWEELKTEIDLPEIDIKKFEEGYFKSDPQDAEPQIDRAEELNKKWQVKTGDLFRVDSHRLLCGDSTKSEDVALVMGGEKGIVFSDPPYGVSIVSTDKAKLPSESNETRGFVGAGGMVPVNAYHPIIGDDTIKTAQEFYGICIEVGIKDFILWGGNYFTTFLPPSPCWLIWDKRENIPSNNFADCEIAWTNFDKPSRIYRHLWSGLLRKGNRKDELMGRVHPTQKPVGLAINIMNDFPAEIYLDGFLGSGSFMVAAKNIGKRMFGIEMDPAYCAVTLERMATAFPGIEIKRIEA